MEWLLLSRDVDARVPWPDLLGDASDERKLVGRKCPECQFHVLPGGGESGDEGSAFDFGEPKAGPSVSTKAA